MIIAYATLNAFLLFLCSALNRVKNVAVNRLVLSLCHAANSQNDYTLRTRSEFEPPHFASGPILGNIGGIVHDVDNLNDFDAQLDNLEIEERKSVDQRTVVGSPTSSNGTYIDGSNTGTEVGIVEINAQVISGARASSV